MIAALVTSVLAPFGSHAALACGGQFGNAVSWVRDAEVIVRARAVGDVPIPQDVEGISTQVRFELIKTLKGAPPESPLAFIGRLTGEDDADDRDGATKWVRRTGRAGSCFARSYWASLGATNEQLFGIDDKWLAWVRQQLKTPAAGVADQAGALVGETTDAWQDPANHSVRFVTVDDGVRLEVLDWGGSGRNVVLLTGSGHTAHVYDEFAPLLTDCCHVYGITRRGFGASSRPSSGYDDQRLADDVLRALEEAKIEKPVLIGHSMAGGEMTTLARQHSDRISGLVYLDAIADLEDEPPADKEWSDLQQKMPSALFPQPVCEPVDKTTFAAFRRTRTCPFGFMLPESEAHNQFESVDGRVGPAKSPGWVMQAIGQQQVYRKDYSNIHVPVLVLMESPRFPESYQPKNADERALIERFVARSRVIVGRWTEKVKRGVPDARFVDVPGGGHYLWVTKQPEVLHEIHAFILSLPARAR
jgi:pimeloyl-ACP methyl ester carboxylesterase